MENLDDFANPNSSFQFYYYYLYYCMVQFCNTVTYVLELNDGKWYVGKSKSLSKRLGEHFSGNGAKWTRLHQPIRVIDILAHDCEEEATLHYMSKFGIDNVRGFSWCQPVLSKYGTSNILNKIDLYSD